MNRSLKLASFAVALAAVTLVGFPHIGAANAADKVARLGFVGAEAPSTGLRGVAVFWERLRELGWVEGQNLVIEARWAEGRIDRLPALMAEVLGRKIDVLVTYSTPGAIAAKNATSTIPIVVSSMGDPVSAGLADSLARPGGNLTGLSLGWSEGIAGKWLELLQETVPHLSTVAVIFNPKSSLASNLAQELGQLAPTRRLKIRPIEVGKTDALEPAFERARCGCQAVLVLSDPFTVHHHQRIAALAAKNHLPGMYGMSEFVDAGGLMAYGVDHAILFRRAAEYVDKILRGAKPADLPIERPMQFSLVVNLKTAKALGITIPQSILLRADEVIR